MEALKGAMRLPVCEKGMCESERFDTLRLMGRAELDC
jgi:hypothetical protein